MSKEDITINDLQDEHLSVRLGQGIALVRDDEGKPAGMKVQTFAYLYQVRFSEKTGKELKPTPIMGPVGVPGKPEASKAELLRMMADLFELSSGASDEDDQ